VSALTEVVAEAIRQAERIPVAMPADKLVLRGAVEHAKQAAREMEQVRADASLALARLSDQNGQVSEIVWNGDYAAVKALERIIALLSDGAPAPTGVVSVPVGRLREMLGAFQWCSGSDDFAPGGQARGGWGKVVVPLMDYLSAALRNEKEEPCPRN